VAQMPAWIRGKATGQETMRWLPHVGTVLALLLVAHSGARLTWTVLAPQASVLSKTKKTTAPASADIPADSGQKPLPAHFTLFGQPPASAVSTRAIPASQLNAKVQGIYAEGRGGAAIISVNNGPENVYVIGDRLPGGSVITGIAPTRVIIRRNGAQEALPLPQQDLSDSLQMASNGGPPALDSALRAVRANPARLMDYVAAKPRYDGTRLQGFVIAPRADGSLFRQAGLKPGDVVVAVNGIPLTDAGKLKRAFAAIAHGTIRVSIIRGGTRRTITIP